MDRAERRRGRFWTTRSPSALPGDTAVDRLERDALGQLFDHLARRAADSVAQVVGHARSGAGEKRLLEARASRPGRDHRAEHRVTAPLAKTAPEARRLEPPRILAVQNERRLPPTPPDDRLRPTVTQPLRRGPQRRPFHRTLDDLGQLPVIELHEIGLRLE